MRNNRWGHPLRGDFLRGLTKGQNLRLGEEVTHQQIMHAARTIGRRQVLLRPGKPDEIGGHQLRALVHQLEERMLAISTWLTPIDFPGIYGHSRTIPSYRFAI